MTLKYEVQFKDGEGVWRRWSLVDTRQEAWESLARLNERLGKPLVRLGFTRVRVVEKP